MSGLCFFAPLKKGVRTIFPELSGLARRHFLKIVLTPFSGVEQ
jgi:hypothetical protein